VFALPFSKIAPHSLKVGHHLVLRDTDLRCKLLDSLEHAFHSAEQDGRRLWGFNVVRSLADVLHVASSTIPAGALGLGDHGRDVDARLRQRIDFVLIRLLFRGARAILKLDRANSFERVAFNQRADW